MNNSKNIIIAVGLSLVVIVLWDVIGSRFIKPPVQQNISQTSNLDGGGSLSSVVSSPAKSAVTADQAVDASSADRIAVKNSQVSGSISKEGVRIDYLLLNNYKETLAHNSSSVGLLSPYGSSNPYYAQAGFLSKDTPVPPLDAKWDADGSVISPGHPVTFTWGNQQGVKFQQTVSIDANYMFNIKLAVINNSGKNINVSSYGLISRSGIDGVKDSFILHEGPIGVFDGIVKEVEYSKIDKVGKIDEDSTGGWLGFTDKYWLVSLIPNQSDKVKAEFLSAGTDGRSDVYQLDYLGQNVNIANGGNYSSGFKLFAGAKVTELLDSYSDQNNIPHFDRAIDFGWYYFLTKPLLLFIDILYKLVGNFGIAILILTVIVRLVLLPLTYRGFLSSYKMRALGPKIAKLKDRFKDDRKALGVETMKLYKEEGVHPMSGCLPLILQIPVFFSLYKVLFVTIEMRHTPFFGWIHDLSSPDPKSILTAFGLIHWTPPTALGFLNIGIWPIIMGVTMYFQQKLNPAPMDEMQKKLFNFLPVIFTFILGTFPAGLVIYWSWNNLLSITQQYIIGKIAAKKAIKV